MGILSWFLAPKYCPGIYRIVNTRTGKFYIGATTHPMVKRWSEHKHKLRGGWHHNKTLQADWREYGSTTFRFEVIEVVADTDQVFVREKHWQHKEYKAGKCYNPDPRYSMRDIMGRKHTRNEPHTSAPKPVTRENILLVLQSLQVHGLDYDDTALFFENAHLPALDKSLWDEAARSSDGCTFCKTRHIAPMPRPR